MMRCQIHLLSKMHRLQNQKGYNYFVSNLLIFKVCVFCPKTNKISYGFRSSGINCPQTTPEPLQVPHAATWTLPNYSEMLYPCLLHKSQKCADNIFEWDEIFECLSHISLSNLPSCCWQNMIIINIIINLSISDHLCDSLLKFLFFPSNHTCFISWSE